MQTYVDQVVRDKSGRKERSVWRPVSKLKTGETVECHGEGIYNGRRGGKV